jgi:GABA(A) receptor-associated protein
MKFKASHSFKERKEEYLRIQLKHPNKIPIICEKDHKSTLPNNDKQKYLVEPELTLGHFMYVIRKRIKLDANQAIYMFIKGTILSSNETIHSIYHKYFDDDGFLYISYTNENTFGGVGVGPALKDIALE